MACGCENSPCAPAPFRCRCQADCWAGPPGDYEACMDACDEDCDFPAYPGYPTEGYTCEDDSGPTACADACYADHADDCDGLEDEALCTCTEATAILISDCVHDCHIDALPDRIDCALAEIAADADCCDTALGDCYEPCDAVFMAAIEDSELAWYECEKAAHAIHQAGYYWDSVEHSCAFDGDADAVLAQDRSRCARLRLAARLPLLKARRLCRAECERDEIRRDDPTERKRAECGSRHHLCSETCGAEFMFARTECVIALTTCIESAVTDEDVQACILDFIDCFGVKFIDNVNCRYDCCVEENAHPPNLREFDPCYLACWTAAYSEMIGCAKDYQECVDDCAPGNLACLAACQAAKDDCEDTSRDDLKLCVNLDCLDPKDCPACATEAITAGCDDTGSYYADDEGGGTNLPTPPACT